MVAIRAAVIPSAPRRTILLTAAVGIPLILASTWVVPTASGGIAWRTLELGTYAWMPVAEGVLWTLTTITCAVISSVVYGLRVEVRHARQLGQYVLEQKIGEGGMGEVYRARHGMMRRPSALKLMRGDRAGDRDIRRFEREVQLTARLTHPNTITIYDYGRTQDGVFYYAMELLDGATLQRIVEVDGAQPPGRVVRILSMAAAALGEAHGIGLIHRDIKPANIMLCSQGGESDVVKLLDFGLVKDVEMDGDVDLTTAHAVAGTPKYMAPEAFLSPQTVDARTDIYAIGAVAYYLLAGAPPFDGATILKLYSQHVHERPVPFAERGVAVPPALEALVLACLEKIPADRPGSAQELRRRLEACRVGPWTSEDARAWWDRNRARLQIDPSPAAEGSMTIAVDR
jgi:serine/threonine-protein kinase